MRPEHATNWDGNRGFRLWLSKLSMHGNGSKTACLKCPAVDSSFPANYRRVIPLELVYQLSARAMRSQAASQVLRVAPRRAYYHCGIIGQQALRHLSELSSCQQVCWEVKNALL